MKNLVNKIADLFEEDVCVCVIIKDHSDYGLFMDVLENDVKKYNKGIHKESNDLIVVNLVLPESKHDIMIESLERRGYGINDTCRSGLMSELIKIK
jgi:hypothetical protein